MADLRYSRQVAFFGAAGQDRLRATTVAVVGAGGVGSCVIDDLALLGVGGITIIDYDLLEDTNRNRLRGVRVTDPVGCPKVKIAARRVADVNPSVTVTPLQVPLVSAEGFAAVKAADYVFGCVDHEGTRLILNELAAAHAKPYFDVGSEIILDARTGGAVYGGRVVISRGEGCLSCLGELDGEEAARDLASVTERVARKAIYGVAADALGGGSGPSVVTINGVVASLATTEFMVAVTGLRAPRAVLRYRGDVGVVTVRGDPPTPGCYYCRGGIWGSGDRANVSRMLALP